MPPIASSTSAERTPPAHAARPTLRRLQDLPSPPAWPLVGHMPYLKPAHIHQDIEALARQLGPLFLLRFGRQKVLVVADHQLTTQVLKARPDSFRRSTRLSNAAHSMGIELGVFQAEGEAWRRQRRMVMASFAPHQVRAYFEGMVRVAGRLGSRWTAAARAGESIDLQADLMRYTVDTISGLAFGVEVNTLEAGQDVIQQHLDEIFPALFSRTLALVPYWKVVPLPKDLRLQRSVAQLHRAIDGFIAQARGRLEADPARQARPANLLEAFLGAAAEPGSGITQADVASNVLAMLLAGEDTTANTLAWMIALLQRNPQALARAQQEVRAALPPGSVPTIEAMDALAWVDACAHETMRLKPVAPFMPVEALHDTTVGDVAVPQGTVVWNVLRHDSVDARHVEQPQAFRPERWLEGAGVSKGLAMPFGAGPRVCPGRYLALLEIKLAMAVLLRDFDILSVDTPDGQEAREHMAFTMEPVGLSMRVAERVEGGAARREAAAPHAPGVA